MMKKQVGRSGGSIYKRGARWWISFYDDGQRVRMSGGATRTEAVRKLRLLMGQGLGGGEPRAAAYSIGQAVEEYLFDLKARGCKPRSVVSARTTTNAALAHWNPELPLREVATPREMQRFLAARKCRNETLRRDLRILGGVFRLAHATGKLRALPVMPKIRATRPAPHILSPDELERVIASALRPEIRAFLVAAAFTGARSGELRRLTWGDVHFERGLVLFRDTKSGVDREVPLHPRLDETLCELGRGAPDTLVFTNSCGGIWHQGELSKAARRAWERAGLFIPGRTKPLHSLRATAASRMVERGASLEEVRQVCGWASLACLPHYIRGNAVGRRRAIELL